MAITYEPVATTTLGSAASSITFSSIPSTYTDLRLIIVALSGTAVDVSLRFNGDSASNYSRIRLIGNGASPLSTVATNGTEILLNRGGLSTTVPSLYEVDFFSYASSNYKGILGTANEDRNGSGNVMRMVGLWRSTSAITSIAISTQSADTLGIGTKATLYGILRA